MHRFRHRWHLAGAIFFGLLTLAEGLQWVWLLPTLEADTTGAAALGLTPEAHYTRRVILAALAAAAVLFSGATLISLFRRARTARFTALFVGLVLIANGAYYIVTALFQLQRNVAVNLALGAAVGLVGALAIWIGRRATRLYREED